MPTILRVADYRFFFFSNERDEPAHIHVEQPVRYAKSWLAPISLAANYGFRSGELAESPRLVQQHSPSFLEKWNELFGD